MPRVSVIVPAFNAAPHLAETLASVEAQTFRDWELILADDASTDETVEIAESFGSRVRVLRTTVNRGPGRARNRAIEASTAELLAFLDADDLWQPRFLERQVALYDASRRDEDDVGIVACDARILSEHGYREETYMQAVRFPPEVTLTRLLVSNPIYVSVLAPRAVVEEVGCFTPDLFGTADYDLWLRIVERGYRVVASRAPLAVYRLGPNTLSTQEVQGLTSLELTYRRALERGNLNGRQRRIARRNIRLTRAQLAMVELAAARRERRLSTRGVARALPLVLLARLEHPREWPDSLRAMLGARTSTSALDRYD